MGNTVRAFLFAALAFFCADVAHAQCNTPSGFLKAKGPIFVGDPLVMGPDCLSAIDGGSGGGAGVGGVAGGRLTLQISTPVPTADQVGASTIYFAPCGGFVAGCGGANVPVYNGTALVPLQFVSSSSDTVGLTLNLNASVHIAGNLYDIFVGVNGGTLQMCTGPGWANSGVNTSARSAPLGFVFNLLSNATQITCSFGSSSFTCPVNQCTYLGTMFASANGQVKLQLHPSAIAGGPNSMIGLCNAFNRIRFNAWAIDSNSQFLQSSTNTWISADNSNSFRINFVSCLGSVQYDYLFRVTVTGSNGFPTAQGSAASVDVACSPTPSGGGLQGQSEDQPAQSAGNQGGFSEGLYSPYPQSIGMHWVQACQNNGTGSSNFFYADFAQLRLTGEF